jgi:hypothetical protein
MNTLKKVFLKKSVLVALYFACSLSMIAASFMLQHEVLRQASVDVELQYGVYVVILALVVPIIIAYASYRFAIKAIRIL